MTLANADHTLNPWYAKAGAACGIVPIARFIGPNLFALKTGGYGCLFSVTGIDEEGLTDQELESRVRTIEGALRGLPEGSCLYEYTRVMSGVEAAQTDEIRQPGHGFLRHRPAHLPRQDGQFSAHRPSLVPHLRARQDHPVQSQAERTGR